MSQAFQSSYDAYVSDVRFVPSGEAVFSLGDGTVRGTGGWTVEAHRGAILCAAGHPSGQGVITGGDDGRLVWSSEGTASELASIQGRWIDAVDSHSGGLIAFAAGRDLHVRDLKDARLQNRFTHEKSVAAVAIDPGGRRIAAATYNGAALWYGRIAEQKPQMLKWAGSHIALAWSPDGKFLMSSMQENSLHGWRLSDAKDMRMGGYPAKVKSMTFMQNGLMLATAGSNGAVIWPFAGANGPMGKEAAEVGYDQAAMVVRVAATPKAGVLAAGLDDGRVWVGDLGSGAIRTVKADKGAPISALAVSPDGKWVAFGDEDGEAGVVARED